MNIFTQRRTLLTVILLTLSAQPPPALAGNGNGDADSLAHAAVKSTNAFAIDLYSRLTKGDSNLFFSPYSLTSALSMTYMGARGETAGEMQQALRFPADNVTTAASFEQLQGALQQAAEKGDWTLTVANALWGQVGFDFERSFLSLLNRHYSAPLQQVDFRNAPEAARSCINRWVVKETRNKIRNLIPRGALTPLTRLVLTNAVYFKGSWERPFRQAATESAPFRLDAGGTVQVPLMHQQATFQYAEKESVQILQMPYAGKRLAMVAVLPKTGRTLAGIEAELTEVGLQGWLAELNTRKVSVFFPRFQLETEFSLSGVLAEMGMPGAFAPSADFSGIADVDDLHIDAVVHKAFVDVNEEGTEAAAATGIIVGVTSARPEPPPVFRADHPFLFIIRDLRTGLALFMGRLTNPS